jgi:hypothetical protein
MKVIDKKFLKFIKNTLKDCIPLEVNSHEVVDLNNDLRNILNEKRLELINISKLYPYLHNQIEIYNELVSTKNLYSRDYLDTCKTLNKEHIYLYSFISRYFKLEEQFGFYSISKKAN